MRYAKFSSFILIGLLFGKNNFAQTINYLDSTQKGISFRGLGVVTDSVFWVSGSKGTVGKTTDGGQHFTWLKPKGFEKRDFRDIEAFDDKTAIIMGIDSPGIILKTKDGGENWEVVYRSDKHGIFLDAMAFKNNLRGICLGDPINGHFFLVETNDGGDTWKDIESSQSPEAKQGEACFASSGTNIQFLENGDFDYVFVSGGKEASLFLMHPNVASTKKVLPIMKGQETTGANSLAINGNNFVVVGGDFKNYKRSDSTAIYSKGVNSFWESPITNPSGYKSCVIFTTNNTLIATGLSGSDITLGGFGNWKHFSDAPFHVVQKPKKGQAIYLAGGNGRIAKIIF